MNRVTKLILSGWAATLLMWASITWIILSTRTSTVPWTGYVVLLIAVVALGTVINKLSE